ncbi:MAG TPA: carbohydrate ABC transporter permease [Chloroflexota bacterium]|nr:carbohydrate ABC transporter permease [Chloroflexota bacterium]
MPGLTAAFRRRRLLRVTARYVALGCVAVIFAFPFYWVLLTSLVPSDHVFDFPPSLLPRWDFANYSTAWQGTPWLNYFLNTGFIAVSTTVLVLATSTLAGFCLATMRFRGKNVVTILIFLSLIMPAIVLIIPDYVLANSLGWLNTYWVQIVPWGASTFGIFLLRQAFLGLPTELYDAARIDGCSRRLFLWAIGAPLVRPALLTVGLYSFLGSYNALLWPLVMTSSNGTDAGVQPIEVGVYSFIGENGTSFNLLCAATVFTMLPVVILFLIFQRSFVEGAIRSGLKG